LGIANVATYSRWHDVEDGVLWTARPEGVVAAEVVPRSTAASAGIERGDVLLAVNGQPISTAADVVDVQHRSRAGERLVYTLLLLHFTLVFPERPNQNPTENRNAERRTVNAERPAWLVPAMYAPALSLAAARVITIARASNGGVSGPALSGALEWIDRAEPVYLFVCAVAALAVVVRGFREISSVTARRQLRWIAWGTALGVGPFAFGYALPWALGVDPPLALQLTAVPLGLVPLTFASAIVRYRLRDVEVIIKRGLAYTAFGAAAVALYAAIRKVTGFVIANDADDHNWIIAALATLVVVLLARPVKDAMQNALDRVFYRDRYDY